MDHLHNSVKEIISLSDLERIERIKGERWIGYTRGLKILDKMEDLLTHPPTHRMPNLLIVGETNNGKTALLHRFHKRHLPYHIPGEDGMHFPVVFVQAPPIPDEKRLYNIILGKIGAPHKINDRIDKKQFQVIEMMGNLNVRMLVIDEIHHILAGNMSRQRSFLNVIKYLSNELKISIVCVGTKDAFNALHTDPQLSNRFEPALLPKWEMNEEYLRLLMSFESLLPLKNPSNLIDEQIAMKILSKSEGTIGEISTLLKRAAIHSIQSGKECITRKTLDEIDWTSPSDRRNRKEMFT